MLAIISFFALVAVILTVMLIGLAPIVATFVVQDEETDFLR
jgi:hypothetical protein